MWGPVVKELNMPGGLTFSFNDMVRMARSERKMGAYQLDNPEAHFFFDGPVMEQGAECASPLECLKELFKYGIDKCSECYNDMKELRKKTREVKLSELKLYQAEGAKIAEKGGEKGKFEKEFPLYMILLYTNYWGTDTEYEKPVVSKEQQDYQVSETDEYRKANEYTWEPKLTPEEVRKRKRRMRALVKLAYKMKPDRQAKAGETTTSTTTHTATGKAKPGVKSSKKEKPTEQKIENVVKKKKSGKDNKNNKKNKKKKTIQDEKEEESDEERESEEEEPTKKELLKKKKDNIKEDTVVLSPSSTSETSETSSSESSSSSTSNSDGESKKRKKSMKKKKKQPKEEPKRKESKKGEEDSARSTGRSIDRSFTRFGTKYGDWSAKQMEKAGYWITIKDKSDPCHGKRYCFPILKDTERPDKFYYKPRFPAPLVHDMDHEPVHPDDTDELAARRHSKNEEDNRAYWHEWWVHHLWVDSVNRIKKKEGEKNEESKVKVEVKAEKGKKVGITTSTTSTTMTPPATPNKMEVPSEQAALNKQEKLELKKFREEKAHKEMLWEDKIERYKKRKEALRTAQKELKSMQNELDSLKSELEKMKEMEREVEAGKKQTEEQEARADKLEDEIKLHCAAMSSVVVTLKTTAPQLAEFVETQLKGLKNPKTTH